MTPSRDGLPAPVTSLSSDGSAFGQFYYRHCCGQPYFRNEEWLAFFGRIADHIIAKTGARTVLDAGCALGLLVEGFRHRGVLAEGVDISAFAIDHVHESIRPYCRRASIADALEGSYDLIVCIEVLEHMPSPDSERAIANFCRATNDILFSSSPWDYAEPTHVNVRPPEHWAELFAQQGFYRDIDFDASFITPWAARFRRSTDSAPRIVRQYERRLWECQRESADARRYSLEVQSQFAAAEQERDALKGALAEADRAREAAAAEVAADRAAGAARAAADREALTAAASVERERMRGDVRRAEDEASALEHRLGVMSDRVFHMERSLFWRARMWMMRWRSRLRW